MQLGSDFRKSMEGTKKSVNAFMSGLKVQASTMLKQLDDRHEAAKKPKKEEDSDSGPVRFPLGGKNGRVDIQLQPNLIDNEYISAVLAHSGYWTNTDVIDYVIDLTSNKEVNDIQGPVVAQDSTTSPSKSKNE
jgi:DNA-binding protein YbaB